MRKVYFVGYESADVVLYLARLCMYSGSETCVVDLTADKMVLSKLVLTEVVPKQEIYRNVHVFGDLQSAEKGKAENIFICCGCNDPILNVDVAADVIYVTDMMPANALRLSRAIKKERKGKRILLVRNEIVSKYTVQSLSELAGIDYKKESVLVLPYDEADYRYGCYLGMDKKTSLKRLSTGMRMMLVELYAEIFGERKKTEYKKMIRKA